jgi:hypothetical protein
MKTLYLLLFVLLFVFYHGAAAQESVESSEINTENLFQPATIKPLAISPVAYEKEITLKEYGTEFFPFSTDKIYHFTSNLGDTKAQFVTTDDGVTLTFDAPNMEYRQTLVKQDSGVFLKRTEMSAFWFFGNDIKYVEPVLRIPFPLQRGDSWEWHALETEDNDTTNLTIRGRVIGEEKIFTPLGEFNCVKIQQHVASENGSNNTLTEWFAPNVGLVKSHAVLEGSGITGMIQSLFGYDEVTFQLVSVEGK